jgi:hypothetical protein
VGSGGLGLELAVREFGRVVGPWLWVCPILE